MHGSVRGVSGNRHPYRDQAYQADAKKQRGLWATLDLQ